jgi:2-dehydro-3-deoxyphosphogalactonate aldolase
MVMKDWLAKCPLIAILRGITPDEVVGVLEELYAAGICIAEIPLNSPEPFEGIRRGVEAFGDRMLIGAGTVMQPAQVAEVHAAGGRLIVTPHADPEVVREAKRLEMFALPGVGTATEAFSMLRAGADGLKLFPADVMGTRMAAGLRAVLPKGTAIVPVGGVDESSILSWRKAGVDGYGLGSFLYKPGMSAAEVGAIARRLVAAIQE